MFCSIKLTVQLYGIKCWFASKIAGFNVIYVVMHTGVYVQHPDIQAIAELIITLSEKHHKKMKCQLENQLFGF